MAQPEVIKDIDARVKKSGDTMTGNLQGKYFQGTWLQTTDITDLNSSSSKIAVISNDGWIYYRTPSELASDIGLTGNYVLKSGDTMTGNLTAPKFIGSLQGNAATATKLQTPRTISLTGATTGSTSFDGSNNVSMTTKRKSCYVGQSSSTATNPYYKFASTTITSAYTDRTITFKVYQGYNDNSTATGILTAHFRTSGTIGWESGQLVWEYADSGIDISKFFLCYKETSGTNVDVQLYVCIDAPWVHYHFDVLSEGDRIINNDYWTLYNSDVAGESDALPNGYTSKVSVLNTLKNNITGNAAKASKLATARTISLSGAVTGSGKFNGSANLNIVTTISNAGPGSFKMYMDSLKE